MIKGKLRNNLKCERMMQGLTQEELAKKTGMSQNSISSIEIGQYNPTAYNAAKICKALNVKFEKIFYIE